MQRSNSLETLETEIRRLKSELWRVRDALLSRAPDEFDEVLRSYYGINPRARHVWLDSVANEIIRKAAVLPGASGPRAVCPLCGESSSSPYSEGFSVPEGLHRHLTGEGKANQCIFARAAFEQAGALDDSRFQGKQELLEERRNRESLYEISPVKEPVLLDECGSGMDAKKLAWAAERLAGLGFVRRISGKVVTFIQDETDYAVFADPLGHGEIAFVVAWKPLPIRKNVFWKHGRFVLRNEWQHNLVDKYNARLQKALESLGSGPVKKPARSASVLSFGTRTTNK